MAEMVTLFYGQVRDLAQDEYKVLAGEMERLARQADGFVSYKSFTADDGDHLSVAVFDSPETHAAWRDNLAHREAQRRGRSDYYSEYEVFVCEVVRRGRWLRSDDT
jgi:heme-degrading monooxygenase HmoA